MKLFKLAAGAILAGALLAAPAAVQAASWTPVTVTCTQQTLCAHDENGNPIGTYLIRTGSQTWCVSGGTSSCTLTQCTYGAWQTKNC
jgi:hypothetical protein